MKKWFSFFLFFLTVLSCKDPDLSQYLLIMSESKFIDGNEAVILLQSKDYTAPVKIFNNHGTSELRILNIESSDSHFHIFNPGSTVPLQFPLLIPAKQSREFAFSADNNFSGSVKITYSYENIEYERTVSVKSQNDEGNDSENPVSGGIRITDPASGRIDFGMVALGSQKAFQVRIENTGKSETVVSRIYFQGSYDLQISENNTDFASELQNVVLTPENTKTFYVRYIPQRAGKITESAVLIFEISSGDLRLSVSGEGFEPETSSPIMVVYDFLGKPISDGGKIAFDSVVVGETSFVNLTIKNLSSKVPLKLTSVRFGKSDTCFSSSFSEDTEFVVAPNQSKDLKIFFIPETIAFYEDSLRFLTEDNQSLLINLTGEGLPKTYARLLLECSEGYLENPDDINYDYCLRFPETTVNTPVTATLKFSNTGNTSLNITSFTIPSDCWLNADTSTVTATPIAPDASSLLKIVFNPQKKQDVSGTILIESNHTGKATLRIRVIGKAVDNLPLLPPSVTLKDGLEYEGYMYAGSSRPVWIFQTAQASSGVGRFRYQLYAGTDESSMVENGETEEDTYSPESHLTDGVYRLNVAEADTKGAWSTVKTFDFKVLASLPKTPEVRLSDSFVPDYKAEDGTPYTKGESVSAVWNPVENAVAYLYSVVKDETVIVPEKKTGNLYTEEWAAVGDGQYLVRVKSVNLFGQTSVSSGETVVVFDTTAPVIELKGDNPLIIEADSNHQFEDPGYDVVDLSGVNETTVKKVWENGKECTVLTEGDYSFRYTMTDNLGHSSESEIRTVTVRDTLPPVVTLKGDASVSWEIGKPYNDPGVDAVDIGVGVDFITTSWKDDRVCTGEEAGIFTVTYTATDKGGRTSSEVTRTVTVNPDTTPPAIVIPDEKEVYDFPVNMWVDQTEEWNTFLESLGITVTDDGGKTVDSFQPGTTTPSGIICSAEYPDVAAEFPQSGLLDTLSCTEESQFLTVYNYNYPLASLNTKTVVLKAEDSSGNTGTKQIRIFLRDTVPPEIEETEITVPFNAESFSYKWKDNSGLRKTETVTVGDYGDYGKMSQIEGRFPLTISLIDSSGMETDVTVFLSVLPPSQENLFPQGNFDGTPYAGEIGDDPNIAGLECRMPSAWMLSNHREYNFFSTWSIGPSGKIPIYTICFFYDEVEKIFICGALQYQNEISAYAVVSYRNVDIFSTIGNVFLELESTCDATLYDSVVYRVSFDYVDYMYNQIDEAPDSLRMIRLTTEKGAGTFGGSSTKEIEWQPVKPSGTDTISALMKKKSGEDIAVNAEWRTAENDFTVRGGNIDSFRVGYIVMPSYDISQFNIPDCGTLISDIRIFAVNWNKLQPDGTVAPANAN